jgi:SecD/SecF fusion protein
MTEKNLNQHLLIIAAVVVVAAISLYPPQRQLQGGLDINGGFSVIFEIDDHGLEDQQDLAERMKVLLQRRIDPTGVSGIVWRVHGRNRLEVQMPLPPPQAAELQQQYLDAQDRVFAANLKRSELEAVLRLSDPERGTRLEALAQRTDTPMATLRTAAQRYDEYLAALAGLEAARAAAASQPAGEATQPAVLAAAELEVRDATERLEDAIDAVLSHNLDEHRFRDVLELDERSPIREATLKQIREQHPHLAKGVGNEPGLIDQVIEAHNRWRATRGYLDGPADLRRLLRGAGVLDFRILAEQNQANPTQWDRYKEQLAKHGPRRQQGDTAQWFKIDQPLSFFHLSSPAALAEFDPAMSGWVAARYNDEWYVLGLLGRDYELLGDAKRSWQLKRAGRSRDQSGRPSVFFELDPRGGDLFRELTRKNVGRQLCILVDGVAYSSATIKEAIGKSGQISGDFSNEKVNYLINTMQAGALPARLKDTPLSERVIGSSLGHENLRRALLCGAIGVGLTICFMIFVYGAAGVIASVATLLNVFLLLGAMAFIDARFTLDGIAGVILAIGMSVDANVLIYERMREERERGSSLRIIIKNGYDKALSTILDSNITTLLVCLIIYYAGSEEIKGFGLTLGWGIVLNIFTAVFVTRVFFTLLIKYRVIKDLKMRKLIGTPNIDWVRHARIGAPIAMAVTLVGLGLVWLRGGDALDVEFRGGVSAEMEISAQSGLNDRLISQKIADVGRSIRDDARQLAQATVQPTPGDAGLFRVSVPGVAPHRVVALIAEPLEDTSVPSPDEPGTQQALLVRGGVRAAGDAVEVRVLAGTDATRLTGIIRGLADRAARDGDNLVQANVSAVLSGAAAQAGKTWNVTTTVTNKQLVQHALVAALGSDLMIQPAVDYTFIGRGEHPFPINDRRLESTIPNLPSGAGADLTDYLGGAAIYVTGLNPPQAIESLTARLRSMRLQPGHQDQPWRRFEAFGVERAVADGQPRSDAQGRPLYTGIVVAVVDNNYSYDEDPEGWTTRFADKELGLVRAALDTEQTLQKVSQFKPQIAGQAQTQALIAMILSWAMMIGYMWLRFGQPIFGFAGVLALIFDVLAALACLGFAAYIGGAGKIGGLLLIEDFKINMPIVAAFLTIIGYSVNDKIVNFDRIRENRGRLGVLSREIINRSLNQTLARTLLTSSTTMLVLLTMYTFGGSAIRGFNFCMLLGIMIGTYTSLAIASPMLLWGRHIEEPVRRAVPAPA